MEGQAMLLQHSIEQSETQGEPRGHAEQEGIVVPLELGEFRLLKQHLQEDGSIEVEVIAKTDRARCPHCQRVCVKVHDTRPRPKRDIPLRGHRIVLVLLKRRFRCLTCRRSFTEPDQACGKRRRTTKRLREHIGKQACSRPVSHVAARLSNCDGVQAVSMDMSTTFREAVQLVLPHARIVADHFHVIQHVGKALKKVIGRHAKKAAGKQALEGQRHLFLRNQEDLSTEEEHSRAALALAFPEIAMAWQLKEALRTWYATTSASTAARDLDRWIASVKGHGPKEMHTALSAFRNWRQEILAFFD